MIVDSHVHVVDPATPGAPHEAFPAERVIADARSAGIDRVVQITPSYLEWDNTYGIESARKYPDSIVGVFGRIDPLAPGVDERLQAFTAEPVMLGARVQPRLGAASERWLADRKLDDFFAAAQRQNVRVGIYAPTQPAEQHDTARRFPGIRFIIEHMALTNQGDADKFDKWDKVLNLAAEPNVWMKVSVFPEVAPPGEKFPFPTSQARFKELYERVGSGRMIWGSNFPPVARVCTYAQSLAFIRDTCDFIPPAEKSAILADNFFAYLGKRP